MSRAYRPAMRKTPPFATGEKASLLSRLALDGCISPMLKPGLGKVMITLLSEDVMQPPFARHSDNVHTL